MKKVLALIVVAFALSATVGCGEEKKTTPAPAAGGAGAKSSTTGAGDPSKK